MHAILTPVGSAGDVNPFVVIGRELLRRGHRVTLIAPEPFSGVAARAGLAFRQVGSQEEFHRTTANPDLWHPRRGPALVFESVGRELRHAYAVLEELYEPGQTMLVGHSLSFFTRVFEDAHGAPAATIHLSPGVFRSDFRLSALPTGSDISGLPRWAKRTLWWALDRFAIDPLIAPAVNALRRDAGLPPVSRVFRSWLHSPQRVIALFPGWFGDPQPDWPVQARLAGFVLSDAGCAPEAEDGLRDVVGDGDPPIVFTPGSANRHAAAFFAAAIEATERLKRRALFVTAYREHLPARLPDHVRHLSYAPFALLFPRAAAVVHHGGIGTCAQALAAGVPQLVMPMGFDQPDNALRVARLGAGERLPAARFTAGRAAAALERLISSADVAAACRQCRERIDSATALRTTCEMIEDTFGAATAGRPSGT